jgi:hypothetical protein
MMQANRRIVVAGLHIQSRERRFARNEDRSMMELQRPHSVDSGEAADEARKIRRLQVMMSMVMSVIGQDPNLTLEEASELAAGARRAALAMFPGKQLAFDILYKPRLQRLMNERYRLQ